MPGAFSTVLASAEGKPARVVSLPLACWAATWDDRPPGDAMVGLRVPPEAELVQARAEAAQAAWRLHPLAEDEEGRIEAFNSAVMERVVAQGTTEPDDVRLAYFRGLDGGYENDRAPRALTAAGIEYLYSAIDLLSIEQSPVGREASSAELARVADALRTGSAWATLDGADVARARRLLRHLADMMGLTDDVAGEG